MKINSLVKIIPYKYHIEQVKKHYNEVLVINNLSHCDLYHLRVIGTNNLIRGASMPIAFQRSELRLIPPTELAKMKCQGELPTPTMERSRYYRKL